MQSYRIKVYQQDIFSSCRKEYLDKSSGSVYHNPATGPLIYFKIMENVMRYDVEKLHLGASAPFRCLHISDSHLLFTDGRDSPAKYDIAVRRYGEYVFKNTGRNITYLLDALIYAKKNCELLLHTGDLLDFASPANFEAAERMIELYGGRFFMCAGNHEYTNYSGQHPETGEEIRWAREETPKHFSNNINFDSQVVNGVNFVAMNNGEHLFSREDTEKFAAETAKGLPIVLLLHSPIYEESAARYMAEKEGNRTMFFAGTPDKPLGREDLHAATVPDGVTLDFIAALKKEPLLRAVLAGHIHAHVNLKQEIAPGVTQYIAGGGYYGCGTVLEID